MALPETIVVTRSVTLTPEDIREEISSQTGLMITRVTDEQVIAELTYRANARFRTLTHDETIWTDESDTELNPYTGKA